MKKRTSFETLAALFEGSGAWGEIQFDLEKGTAWVKTFAENDFCDTWEITDAAIQAII